MFLILFGNVLQSVMYNSTGDSPTKYPQYSTIMMNPHTGKTKRLGNAKQSCIMGIMWKLNVMGYKCTVRQYLQLLPTVSKCVVVNCEQVCCI